MKKSVAAAFRRWAQRLDPQKPRPLYGDVHVNLASDGHRFVTDYGSSIRAAGRNAKDLAAIMDARLKRIEGDQ